MAFYVSANSKNSDINPLSFMPHEDQIKDPTLEEYLDSIAVDE